MIPSSANPRPVHFRVPSRSKFKTQSLRAPRTLLLFVSAFAFLSWWNEVKTLNPLSMFQSAQIQDPSERSNSNVFTYGPINVERFVQYVGDAVAGEGGRQKLNIVDERVPNGAVNAEQLPGSIREENDWTDKEQNQAQSNNIELGRNGVTLPVASTQDIQINGKMEKGSGIDERRADTLESDNAALTSSATGIERREQSNFSEDQNMSEQHLEPARGGHANAVTNEEEELVSLREWLKFTPNTAINFMHFHKTGGVSFKTSLLTYYVDKFKGNGNPVVIRDACYVREGVLKDADKPTFAVWRCDWHPMRIMREGDRNMHDLVFGHQFWKNGAGELLNKRDLRTFTILRHPFDRKVSFYYHFFVREVGRKEENVSYDEIREFLLFDKLRIDADLGRDLGPNYMAGRLLSDGVDGYVGNDSFRYFDVEPGQQQQIANQALELVRDYIFVGLQSQNPASKCMLRKVIELFNDVNGIPNINTEEIDTKAAAMNQGSYSLSAKQIWGRFSKDDQATFYRKERVDLMIYEEGERLFRKHVKLFRCEHKLVQK